MAYTKIPKPTNAHYTNTNSVGREQYDQSDIIYDSPTVFYDGTNQNQYTKLSKPSGNLYTKIAKPL